MRLQSAPAARQATVRRLDALRVAGGRPAALLLDKAAPLAAMERPSALDTFAAMTSMLNQPDTTHLRGYVGEWTAWSLPDELPAAAGTPVVPVRGAAPVNFRLFRWLEPPGPDGRGGRVQQVNAYQSPGKAAAAYKPYLAADGAPAPRADGFLLREWTHAPDGALWQPDASSWRPDGAAAAPEATLLALPVPGHTISFVNAGLPPAPAPAPAPTAGEPAPPKPWYLEFMFREPGSHERRWGLLLRYDDCRLAEVKSITEGATQLPGPDALAGMTIEPASIEWLPSQPAGSVPVQPPPGCEAGAATRLAYDQQHRLTRERMPCRWAPPGEGQGSSQQLQLAFPDGLYLSVPRELSATSGRALLEGGVVMRDGSLARMRLAYDCAGRRLLQDATYELYAAA